ncbi:MAG TPA: hypothetical protein VFV15_05230 [Moraxellaceae bacterium]|nr:hypothetical protein [Moraxellaceae bacterium]
MADSLNPYAPPTARLVLETDADCWRDGKQVVLRRGADFPHRCVRCNAPGTPRARAQRFYWHSPWLYLLVIINILVYAVVALLARRSVKLHPALCDAHRRERRNATLLVIALVIGGVGLLGAALDLDASGSPLQPYALGAVPAVMLLAIAVAAWKLRTLTAARIDADEVRVRGVGRPFLDSLPEYPGVPTVRR